MARRRKHMAMGRPLLQPPHMDQIGAPPRRVPDRQVGTLHSKATPRLVLLMLLLLHWKCLGRIQEDSMIPGQQTSSRS